jgi:hypothetical protein
VCVCVCVCACVCACVRVCARSLERDALLQIQFYTSTFKFTAMLPCSCDVKQLITSTGLPVAAMIYVLDDFALSSFCVRLRKKQYTTDSVFKYIFHLYFYKQTDVWVLT